MPTMKSFQQKKSQLEMLNKVLGSCFETADLHFLFLQIYLSNLSRPTKIPGNYYDSTR